MLPVNLREQSPKGFAAIARTTFLIGNQSSVRRKTASDQQSTYSRGINMNAREAVNLAMDSGQMIGLGYLDDMTDEELMHRPHPDCNHIKWQLGHLISSEHHIINGVLPGTMPELPEGFGERYTPETAKSDDASAFDSKEELLKLYNEQRAAAVAKLESLTDEDLSQEGPEEMKAYAPTVGAAFDLLGGHWLMHAGQWAVIRRQLGRPPLF